jgi:hypothetical protein
MAALPANNTNLLIIPLSGSSALTLTPYSARGLTQTLEPITGTSNMGTPMGTWFRESINGELINLMPPGSTFRKYQSVITCKDTETPCLDDAWLGEICLVDCACCLNYLTGGSPQRSEVSGSSYTEGSFTFYRPQLTMMVIDIKNSFAEYPADYQWSISLREVAAP